MDDLDTSVGSITLNGKEESPSDDNSILKLHSQNDKESSVRHFQNRQILIPDRYFNEYFGL